MRARVRSSTSKPSELVLFPPNSTPSVHFNCVYLNKLCADEFLHHTPVVATSWPEREAGQITEKGSFELDWQEAAGQLRSPSLCSCVRPSSIMVTSVQLMQ
jgi:hypothetical protein